MRKKLLKMSTEEFQSSAESFTSSVDTESIVGSPKSTAVKLFRVALLGLGLTAGSFVVQANADNINPILAKIQGAVYTPYEDTPTALERLESEGHKNPIVVPRNK